MAHVLPATDQSVAISQQLRDVPKVTCGPQKFGCTCECFFALNRDAIAPTQYGKQAQRCYTLSAAHSLSVPANTQHLAALQVRDAPNSMQDLLPVWTRQIAH